MDYFVEELMRELDVLLKGTFTLVRMQIKKNNGTLLTGIRFERKDRKVSPVVYLEKYYEDYTNGDMTMNNILTSITDQLEENVDMDDIANNFQNYDLIKNDLDFAVINYELNKEILKERIHKRFLDLAAVCLVRVETQDGLNGIMYVTNHMLIAWKIDEETLMEQCMRNLIKSESHSIFHIKDVLIKMFGDAGKDFIDEMMKSIFDEARKDIYVLSNKSRHMGANALLNYDMLHNFAMEHDSNLIIFPSSVHELIVILETDYEAGMLGAEEVKHINEEQVYKEEWLSNSVYIYDREKKKLLIYQQGESLCNNSECERGVI
ncbi:MAG: DUF5688 family protein [Lachnospiraceae bacterium]|nr:DUF5688 family protein [Lachnospiraceae bacterium]